MYSYSSAKPSPSKLWYFSPYLSSSSPSTLANGVCFLLDFILTYVLLDCLGFNRSGSFCGGTLLCCTFDRGFTFLFRTQCLVHDVTHNSTRHNVDPYLDHKLFC